MLNSVIVVAKTSVGPPEGVKIMDAVTTSKSELVNEEATRCRALVGAAVSDISIRAFRRKIEHCGRKAGSQSLQPQQKQ